ncbi:hypothetical protein CVUC_06875 [Caulobacter vibrioides]|nr:hypothetical protein CA608_01395 [Caulobacter vibrioides]PLR13049.1 hypothetical protein CVUC_06875 [Caulobacter vibrioides]
MRCQAYFGVEELFYSNAGHGDVAGTYDGGVYIKETMDSALLRAQAYCDPTARVRHFLFVGGDYCYEVLSFAEPSIYAFDSHDEAMVWASANAA